MNALRLIPGLLLASVATAFADEALLSNRVAALEERLAAMEQQAAASTNNLRAYWKNGFILEQPDKAFRLQLGGRVQLDTAFYDADPELEAANDEFNDGVKFRRARLHLRGTMYDQVDFVAEYDFAGSTTFRSVYLGLRGVPLVGNLRIGHMIEPFGLEEYCSNNFIVFLERGLTSAFTPAENTGAMVFDTAANERMTWAAGVFKDTGALGDSVSNEQFAVTARLTGLPYAREDGRSYAHLGYAHSYRALDDVGYRVRARPESYIAPFVVDTKALDADSANMSALEAVATFQSLSFQGEYIQSAADLNAGDDLAASDADFSAWYVLASYFLTGEHRPYNRKDGILGRITPRENAGRGHWSGGAWELATRYATIDLNDGGIEGGEMDTRSIGLNWYLNPHTRFMGEYTLAEVEDEGDADILQFRVQFDF